MSYLIDGLDPDEMAVGRLRDDFLDAFGIAGASMAADGAAADATSEPLALLLDRRAATWDALRDWLARWARDHGFAAAWSAGPGGEADSATLHLDPG